MGEVRYSVNGKYFKDFGIYISSSDGLFDALKRKKINTYDWAEYHGSSPDLSNPKFEAREITLVGFVVGENWEVMKSNFDAIISEFQKEGTQRLLIEPFGLKPLPYEVYMDDSISLKKTFKDGKMVGTFTLKIIEPNPLKIVLYTTGTMLNLSYNSPNETEIFYGNGLKETAKGNVLLSGKTLASRVLSGYAFEGRNYLRNSSFINSNFNEWNYNVFNQAFDGYARLVLNNLNMGIFQQNIPVKKGDKVTLSVEIKGDMQTNADITTGFDDNRIIITTDWSIDAYKLYSVEFEAKSDNPTFIFFGSDYARNEVFVKNLKLEKSNSTTPWTIAPEDEKYIIIAGNVEEITNLTTNADVLWERL